MTDRRLAGLSPKVICEQLEWMASRVRDMEEAARAHNWLTPAALDKLTIIAIALDKTHAEVSRDLRA